MTEKQIYYLRITSVIYIIYSPVLVFILFHDYTYEVSFLYTLFMFILIGVINFLPGYIIYQAWLKYNKKDFKIWVIWGSIVPSYFILVFMILPASVILNGEGYSLSVVWHTFIFGGFSFGWLILLCRLWFVVFYELF